MTVGVFESHKLIILKKNIMTVKKTLKKVLSILKEWGKGAAYAVNHGNNR